MVDPDSLRKQLRDHGERRRRALDEGSLQLEEIIKLAPEAIDAGISLREIGKLGDVSRPTLYARLEPSAR